MFDEIVPDVQVHIIEEEGFNYFSGYLGKGNKKLAKTLTEQQTLPTSKLSDFENFVASDWIDARNSAFKGRLYHTIQILNLILEWEMSFKILKASLTYLST